MITPVFQPAVFQLVRLQWRGRRRRMWQRFYRRRRLVFSTVECLLVALWVGNAVMTTWLRGAASPETMRTLLSLGLVLYAGWHLTKAAFFTIESPFDGTPAERELLAAMPLRPTDLCAYQLASVSLATLVKAGLMTLLLLPEIGCAPLGFVGLLLALLELEMLRMAMQIVTWAMGRVTFLVYRAAAVTALVLAGLSVGTATFRGAAFGRTINAGKGFIESLLDGLLQLSALVFHYATLPFQSCIDLILADAITPTMARLMLANLGCVTVLCLAVMGLSAASHQWVACREKRSYGAKVTTHSPSVSRIATGILQAPRAELIRPMPSIRNWCGVGALAWRQLMVARRHWGRLLSTLIVPAVLACAPCFLIADRNIALLVTTCCLAFFTFQLLPAALRLDFRRDVGRLTAIKALPLTPAAAAVGQTLLPVLIVTSFQCAILGIAVVARSLPLHHFITMMLMMIPLNVIVFSLENLLFLLYPCRAQQEGLEMFFRTMFTFTGKGLLFVVGLAAIVVWSFTAAALTREISEWTGAAVNTVAVFNGGMIAGLTVLAVIGLLALSRTFQKANLMEDFPN